jgi:hypothetical protein
MQCPVELQILQFDEQVEHLLFSELKKKPYVHAIQLGGALSKLKYIRLLLLRNCYNEPV